MEVNIIPHKLRRHEIPGRVEIISGCGSLPLVKIHTPWSTAEIYLLGAHAAAFQKKGEPPLLFMSSKSSYALGKPIRGGVPICFPWFGPRAGDAGHGFARLVEWDLAQVDTTPDGAVTLRFCLPEVSGRENWKNLRTEFVVTVGERFAMELVVTNPSTSALEVENCLHTYFQVADIGAISLTGLQGVPFDDFAAGLTGVRKVEHTAALRITAETNRVYPDHSGAVKIHDEKLRRTICVEKSGSASTVVWNPWTTQKLPDDFDPPEYKTMVCVESGNIKQNRLVLEAGQTASLKVVVGSAPLE